MLFVVPQSAHGGRLVASAPDAQRRARCSCWSAARRSSSGTAQNAVCGSSSCSRICQQTTSLVRIGCDQAGVANRELLPCRGSSSAGKYRCSDVRVHHCYTCSSSSS